MGGPDGKIFGSRSVCTDQAQQGLCVLTTSQIFPVRPDLTQSISILSYDHFFFSFSYFWWNEDTRISSRAVRIFLALSPQLVRPSYGSFILMVFRGNYARGRMGHMINSFIFMSGYLCTEGVEGHPHRAHPSPHFL